MKNTKITVNQPRPFSLKTWKDVADGDYVIVKCKCGQSDTLLCRVFRSVGIFSVFGLDGLSYWQNRHVDGLPALIDIVGEIEINIIK